ncbi:hydrogenase [Pseudoalteromonas luteoviolacea]|uniref:hydrogenase n=1 Tax=Pseudoalteromonas luteoviolacea TaxID=43657 RepID=UPI001B394BD1|nr:hydrogenase [Pseudoalteromonas luteoviolacea]MBQ4811256.1 hydrogenase [Pseudoalteromonas luteoviolacea]
MIELTQIGAQLIVIGVVFFLVGLVQGALIPIVKNARMALSGHLTAVQCAMALAIFGVIWSLVELPLSLEVFVAYGCALGFILIWLGITIASITGASKALPIAGAGFSASAISEISVTVMVRTGSLLSLITCALLAFGLLPILSSH